MPVKAGPISADRLKSFIEWIEKLLEEHKAIGSDVRDVFAEAKGVGYDVKTMRSIIKVRAMDKADRAERETLLDVYMHALGMETPANVIPPTEEELEEKAGKVVAEIERCMSLIRPGGKPPKIDAIMALIGCSQGKASKLRGHVERQMEALGISRSKELTVKNEITTTAGDKRPAGEGTGAVSTRAEAPALAPIQESCGQPNPDCEDGGDARVSAAAPGPQDPDAIGTAEVVIPTAPTFSDKIKSLTVGLKVPDPPTRVEVSMDDLEFPPGFDRRVSA